MKVSGAVLGGMAAGSTVVAAERTDRFIVDTKDVPSGELEGAVDVVFDMGQVDLAVVEGTATDLEKVTENFAPDVEVELDDPDVNGEAPNLEDTSVADEPLYPLQWDKEVLDISAAHETTKGEGTRVAVIDNGVAAGHPDLDVNKSLSRNFTGDGLGSANPAGGYHGTHVGGIIAAQTDNEIGVAGTAPETELVDCRVFSPSALASFGDIFAAITYSAAIGADAANLSLGAYPVPRQGLGSFYGKVMNRIMTYANSQGTLLVVAAGNDGADLQHDKNFISLPNEGAQGLSVSATGPIGFGWDASDYGGEAPAVTPALYTNYGTNAVDLGAPGGNYDLKAYAEYYDGDAVAPPWYYDMVLNTTAYPTYATDEEGNVTGIDDVEYTYSWIAGTSMAAPQVAGAAALVKSANPGYNANQVEAALKDAADVPEGYDKTYYGSGFLNIVDAL